nr:HAD hydrolase family protein [Clostridium sp. OM04-12AA]
MHSEKTTIRLAAVDMDGTLLHDDKSISDYTLDVLRRIVKKGVILVPASGRPIGGMKEAVLNNVDGIQYAICSNGAMLMDVPEEKSICETGIPTEKAVEAIAYLEQFPVAVYAIQTKVLSGQRAGRKQGFLRNILISGSAKEM